MATATLTSKGQVTIPKVIREKLHLRTGDRLDFVEDTEGRILLAPASSDVRRLRGLLHRPGQKPASVAQMDQAIARHLSEKMVRVSGGRVDSGP